MLTLFVVPSGKPNANYGNTVDSFLHSSVRCDVVRVDDWREINNYDHKKEWFAIFWDNEYIDVGIQEVLHLHLNNKAAQVIVIYKKLDEETIGYRTRIMRRAVYLGSDFKPIAPWIAYETLLDGWIKEHE